MGFRLNLIIFYIYIFLETAWYISEQSTVSESIKINVVVEEMLADIWKPSEYWKRVTCIMMIHAGYENADIMTAAQCSMNIEKVVRRIWTVAIEIMRP